MIELRLLRYFIAVAETEHVGRPPPGSTSRSRR
jgi:hypothetical protein